MEVCPYRSQSGLVSKSLRARGERIGAEITSPKLLRRKPPLPKPALPKTVTAETNKLYRVPCFAGLAKCTKSRLAKEIQREVIVFHR